MRKRLRSERGPCLFDEDWCRREGFGGDIEGGLFKTGDVGTAGARRTGIAAPARVVKLFLRVPKRKREVRPPVVLEVLEELREGL